MAWKICNRYTRSVDGDVPQVTIVCDAESDVSDLPTTYAPGSIAVVADTFGSRKVIETQRETL